MSNDPINSVRRSALAVVAVLLLPALVSAGAVQARIDASKEGCRALDRVPGSVAIPPFSVGVYELPLER